MREPGTLVYLRELITLESVMPARLAEVVEDLEDTMLVRVLNPDTLEEEGEKFEVGEEEVITILDDNRAHPATRASWRADRRRVLGHE
jgi:hypothetical protein